MNSEVFSKALRSLLQLGWVDVLFTKKDGSSRLMYCTTNMEKIPEEDRPTESKTIVNDKEPEEDPLFKVYEYGKGWRSFRFSQIQEIQMDVR